MFNLTLLRPRIFWIALLGIVGFSCAHSGAAKVDSGGTALGGSSGYLMEDLDGDWVGTLFPNSAVLDPFNFYFSAADGGVISEGADSKGNQWLDIDSEFTSNILNSGRMMAEFDSMVLQSRLFLDGKMSDAMTELTGDYEYVNNYGIPVRGSFILSRSTGNDYFAGLDYSGPWVGGFGVGRNENKRQLDFVLDSDGAVVYGSMTNIVTGVEIHRYSVGAGSFAATNLAVGRIDNLVLTADDGSIAECEFLLVDRDLSLIGGTGVDSDVGEGTIEIRK